MKQQSIFHYVLIVIGCCIAAGWSASCANIVPPSGGRIDTIPPKLLKLSPADSSINIKPRKIELTFDKFMVIGDLSKEMTMSPLLPITPMVTANLKKVTITIQDTMLADNTTYVINLGKGLKDNREGTPAEQVSFTFSTGSYFDSLTLAGKVLNAYTGLPDTGYTAVLYPVDKFKDSIVFKSKPEYVTTVDNQGNFQFKILPNRPFKLLVLRDADNDLIYEPGKDHIAFMDGIVSPTTTADTQYTFYAFKEAVVNPELEEEGDNTSSRRSLRGRSTISFKADEWYKVMVDTIQKDKGTQSLLKPISIYLNKQVQQIEKDKIFLTVDRDGTEIEAITTIEHTDSLLLINTEWSPNSSYTLRLIKGWAKDSTGVDALPGKYIFKSMNTEAYSALTLQFPTQYINAGYLYRLDKGTDSIAQGAITDSIIKFPMLEVGEYTWRIIQDGNGDGQWTTGNYLQGLQPEKAWTNAVKLVLKPGWEHVEKFTLHTVTQSIRSRVETNPKQD